ncbi:hypothetical protein AYO21_06485 [Fonsecaea monophora]|uniref:Uncharacterized protein n=1 Tax=Fonsecaea monophora TaxID=254056 RepID=A0A177F6J1_9EURO|nr:hypothetical protein AYO21_06485 [Fonsecaea monophora]KAH0830955.1 5'-hydroxyaverantin dehydrogenase [Fonsecaea pedrosoi]OAG39281.1 hypothetical protein AYO21_06485 [Fonsecaea monophora]
MSVFAYTKTGPADCPADVDYSKVQGKTVIITGGSNGLGAAYIKAFAENGFLLEAMLAADHLMLSSTGSILFVTCDVTSWDDLVALFETARAKSPNGGIDVVIANAGIFKEDLFFAGTSSPLSCQQFESFSALVGSFPLNNGENTLLIDLSQTGLDSPVPTKPNLKMMDVNIYGVFYTAKLAAHYFSQQPEDKYDRCLILIGSVMSYLDTYGAVSYGMSKHGVRGLMGVLRRRGIMRVNMLAPWYTPSTVNTAEFQNYLEDLFASQGLSFAEVNDAVKVIMRIATDPTLNGRTLSNVPRLVARSGYVDFAMDDFEEGSILDRFQRSVAQIKYTHMASPPSKK